LLLSHGSQVYFQSIDDMKPIQTPIPVFALDETTTWVDLEDAMEGSVEFQSSKRGKILPLMCFAPMTEPENLDAWEPMKVLPENLLVVSIERSWDAIILKALKRAEPTLGEVCHAATFPLVRINFELPLADVYKQMTEVGILAYTMLYEGKDDTSFFFLRSGAAVKAFDKELRNATR
jgi:hypothetical protein